MDLFKSKVDSYRSASKSSPRKSPGRHPRSYYSALKSKKVGESQLKYSKHRRNNKSIVLMGAKSEGGFSKGGMGGLGHFGGPGGGLHNQSVYVEDN